MALMADTNEQRAPRTPYQTKPLCNRSSAVGGRRAWVRAGTACGVVLVAAVAGLVVIGPVPRAAACPVCAAVSQTLSEEMESTQVVALARLEGEPVALPGELPPPNQPLPRTRFVIEKVLKGQEWAKPGQVIDALYFGEGGAEKRFLLYGSEAPTLQWSTPLPVSSRAIDYVQELLTLPKDASRLEFFQEYLEDADPMLAADAYDEFAKTPYAGVIALKDKMHRDRLLKWIHDPELPATRKRLYFTMLGICYQPEDAQLLEQLMRADDRKARAGLDALIACYLMLTKEQGLPLVEELFLKNRQAEYADTYAAIMALRFHGTEVEVLPRPALVQAMRLMLDRPELADLVIPDLARWEDWDAMPKLVELFKTADENSSWVRVPVINFLRACPLPEAAAYIEQLEKIDPDAVRRANTIFAFGGLPALSDQPPSDETTANEKDSQPGDQPAPAPSAEETEKPAQPSVPVEAGGEGAAIDVVRPHPRSSFSGSAAESGDPGLLAEAPRLNSTSKSLAYDGEIDESVQQQPPVRSHRVDTGQGAGEAADRDADEDHAATVARRDDDDQPVAVSDPSAPATRLARQRQAAVEMLSPERSAIVDRAPVVPPRQRAWRAVVPFAVAAALTLSMRRLLVGSLRA
jgi:hypothetical protein